ncbi:MAG: hypothetical protein ACI4TD_10045 [Phocaeicola sp.]
MARWQPISLYFDGLKSFDFSIPVGLSYEISDFVSYCNCME